MEQDSTEPGSRAMLPAGRPYWESKHDPDVIQRIADAREAAIEASGIGRGRAVLDLGAGSGEWLMPLASRFESVVAVEPDASTRETLGRVVAQRAELRQSVSIASCTAEALGFADGTFDVVFCKNAFQYMDQPRALREMWRVLKPGGRLFVNSNAMGYYLLQIVLGLRHVVPAKVRYGLICLVGTLFSQLSGRRMVGQRFSSVRWATRLVTNAGFVVVRAEPWIDQPFFPPRFMGCLTHFAVQAEKPTGAAALSSPAGSAATRTKDVSTLGNIGWYAFPRLLSGGMTVMLLPIYSRVLAPEEFGMAMVVLAVATLGGLFVAPGIEGAYMRWAHQRSDTHGVKRTGAGTLTILHLAMLTVGVGALIAGARIVSGMLMPGIPVWPFYYVVVGTLCVTSLQAPLRAEWRANHRGDKVARLEFGLMAIATVTILVALLVVRLGPISIILGDFVAGLILLPICVKPILAALPEGWDRRAFKAIGPIALVGLPLSFSGYVLATLDRIVLNSYAGAAAVGIYAVAYSVASAIMLVSITLNKEWQPLIFRLAGGAMDRTDTLQRLWTRSVCLVFLAGSVVACFSVEIVRWGLGPQYIPSAMLVPWVVLMFMLRIARSFLTNLGLALSRAADLTVEGLISVAVFAAMNLVFVPAFGARGAAWAGIFTYAIGLAFLLTRSWNTFRIDLRLTASTGAVCAAVLLAVYVGGTMLTRVLGVAFSGLLIIDAAAYWGFLRALDTAKAES